MEREIAAGGLWWRVYGEAISLPPLVVMHGLFGSGDNWRSQAISLAEDRTVLVCDMPNHGRSEHRNTFDYRALAELLWKAVNEVLFAIGAPEPPVALLGHSMGGKAAMAMAISDPDRCERLVVADIAPRRYPSSHDAIFAAMEAVAVAGVASRGEADRIMAEHVPQKAIRMFLLKSLVPEGAEAGGSKDGGGTGDRSRYRWRLNRSGLREGYEDIRAWPYEGTDASYTGPTLFVVGGASPYIVEEDGSRISHHFPNASIRTIDRAGHWLHAEARDEFVSIVREFFS